MIIFDLDGTLWNTLEITENLAVDFVKEKGIKQFDKTVIAKGMGLSLNDNAKLYFPEVDNKIGQDYLKQIIDKINVYVAENGANIYDGVVETIKELSKNNKLAIVTNSTDEYVRAFYKISGLESYFCDYMGAATYNITKAEAIRKVVSRNHDEKSYYVGDIEKDMVAATEAGIDFIHARYGFGNDFSYKSGIDSIKDIINVFKK